jgi:hypothetical protein
LVGSFAVFYALHLKVCPRRSQQPQLLIQGEWRPAHIGPHLTWMLQRCTLVAAERAASRCAQDIERRISPSE